MSALIDTGQKLQTLMFDLHEQIEQRLAETNELFTQYDDDHAAVRNLRIAVQKKAEALEKAHFSIVNTIQRTQLEYERLAKWADRAAAMMVAKPPESPQAPKRAIRAIKDIGKLKAELFANSQTVLAGQGAVSGVYFLMRDADVVYVGQSVNVLHRVAQHCTDDAKDFNRWCFIKVKRQDLDEIERFYITLLRPEHNVQHKPAIPAETTAIFQEAAEC